MRPEDLSKRCSRIRLPKSKVAERADLDENTVCRALGSKPKHSPLTSTLREIEKVVVAEELELRDHLLELHPIALPQPVEPEGAA